MERRWQPKISIEFVESKRLRCEIRAANLLRCACMNWIKWFCTKGSASQFTHTHDFEFICISIATQNLWEWKLKLIIQTNFSRTEVPSKFDISRLILGVCYIHQFWVTLMHSDPTFGNSERIVVDLSYSIFFLSRNISILIASISFSLQVSLPSIVIYSESSDTPIGKQLFSSSSVFLRLNHNLLEIIWMKIHRTRRNASVSRSPYT